MLLGVLSAEPPHDYIIDLEVERVNQGTGAITRGANVCYQWTFLAMTARWRRSEEAVPFAVCYIDCPRLADPEVLVDPQPKVTHIAAESYSDRELGECLLGV